MASPQSSLPSDVILATAASDSHAQSVLVQLGSLRANWPDHPPVTVYDLGMKPAFVAAIEPHAARVVRVPPFVPHWRRRMCWRGWVMRDLGKSLYIWLDGGVLALRPLTDMVQQTVERSYFCSTNLWPLLPNVNPRLKVHSGKTDEELGRIPSINSGIYGLDLADPRAAALRDEFYEMTLDEGLFTATHHLHRHDQPALTLLLWKYFGNVLYADARIYGGWESPASAPAQAIWVHRRHVLPADARAYVARLLGEAEGPHKPSTPPAEVMRGGSAKGGPVMKIRKQIAAWRGRTPPPQNTHGVRGAGDVELGTDLLDLLATWS
ncbi:hypothetical protein LzC2_36230 [Planctomycetes bacterium LzC2]|uniref:Uncharacterized protein n=1 Tax=Alienimonas chondri TaxID=2681879 RepID=A0ABX1VJU2_9PLAN|nr:hypothetical protein [Alienimonas chondri]